MKEKDITFGNYSPEFKPTPLSSTGDTPVDFYSWGENPSGGLITRKQQMDAKLEKAFDSIEISEDPTTTETDYVLKVLGKDAGRLVMPIDSIINNAYYDKQTQELVLVISMGDTEKEIRINVKDLVDDYKGDDATISIDENNVISIKKEVMDKFTDLYKSISDETAAREAKDTELQGNIEAEAATRESADEALQGAIDAETEGRTAADEVLQAAIDAESTSREAKDTELQENIDAEATARTSADEALQEAIDAEVATRTSEDAKLQEAINAESAARESVNKALQGAIDTEASTRETKDTELQGNIDAESAAREAKDTEFQGVINTEVTTREAKDTELQAAINAEATARETKDIEFQGVIDAEAAAREAKDTEFQGVIDAEAAARTSADTNLQNAINKEIEDREAADVTLQNSIATTLSDSKSYTDSEIAKEVARAKEAENTLKDSKADKEHTHQISEVETLQTVLDTKLTLDEVKAILNEQIYKLFKTVVVDTADFNTADTTNPNESYALVGDGETISMTQSKSFIGKSVKLGNIDLSSESSTKSVLNIVANDSELDNLTLSGTWSRSVGGNTMISLNNAQNVTVSDVEVSRTGGYNAVEIGLDGKGTVKSVVIDGLEISSSLSNNGINIFSFEDNANIVIKNCHFTEVSNPIRISNMTYAKNVNITIQDCTFDSWESGTPAYAGLVLLQDHTSASTEEFNEKNPFATFNITIDNVTGPYGKIASGQTMEDICASQIADKQLVYTYVDKATPSLIPYTSDKYPTITIK